ncbi:MAG: ChbG/HpnK family deacetylase [Erysipelotrichaceae bacterium]|nr:ChbG/HpnK family deacetylase [Erysipelotrichaceae bacterium]
MKLIVRADDVGYTKAHNDGTFEAIDNGIVTSVDLMFDTPGTMDALIRMKEYPWISIGWHAHFWGKPLLDPKDVPSMVNTDGRFKFRKDQSLKKTCSYDDVLRESRAQIELCLSVLGRAPDSTWIQDTNSNFERARIQVCKEYGIAINFADKPDRDGKIIPALEHYRDLKIYMPNQPATVYRICYHDSYEERKKYDPVTYYVNDDDGIMDKEIVLTAWHPGYLDPYVMNESSLTEARVIDVKALTSEEIKDWVIKNKIELVNTRDALFGTREYQNHLHIVHSKLEVI